MTYKEYMGDVFEMQFNSQSLPDYISVLEVTGRSLSPNEINTMSVSGMDGSYIQGKRKPGVSLKVKIMMRLESSEDLREAIDELNEFFDTEEEVPIIFSDEPNKTYYGMMSDISEGIEVEGTHIVTITFFRSDPYKYGPEESMEFQSDADSVDNQGKATAFPVFELEVHEPTTFAMIQNQRQEYMMIGTPAEDDVEVVSGKDLVLTENGSTLDTWDTNGTEIDNFIGNIAGSMRHDGTGILAESYGTGEKMHGPAVIKEISPIQDFEIETTFDIISNHEEDNYRMEVYMFDEGMNMLGKMGINDNNRNLWRRLGLGRVGGYAGPSERYAINGDNYKRDDLGEVALMYLRVKREGKKFTFYIAEIRNGRHYATIEESINVSNEYLGKLKYIQLFIGNWQDRNRTFRTRINYVHVYKLQELTVDQTRYIAYPGDIITFGHKNEEILINGEDRSDLKDFGGTFFHLYRGENQLLMHPPNTFFGKLHYNPRFP